MGIKVSEMDKDLGGFFNTETVDNLNDADRVLTIARYVADQKVGQDGDEKPVLYFSETKKGLILSKGRVQQLGALFGEEDITNQKIQLGCKALRGIYQICIEGTE